MFLSGSVEDKQFITQLVVSKCTYYNKKLDIELFPVFYSLMGLPVLTGNETATIEQLEMQTTSTKKAPEGANLINGGNDAHRFELIMQRYYSNLATPNMNKICYLINLLTNIA
ncbi:TPA: hypothetical protein IAD41_05110 [Candidatus Scatenecus faecavium]|uniref:Uncharacterized protein n=1 Tax=Candidatus Scatenecus faecavium TaxID=2840915 RepID=A0A9D1FWE9_9BACT|nr:hypothetical protein [Candidatus Scatenecus faecavium]